MELLTELTVVAALVALVILLISLVGTGIQIKKTFVQVEQLLGHLNRDTPTLFDNLHEISKNVRITTHQTKQGVTHVMILFNAVGEIGLSVKHLHMAVLDQGKRLLKQVDSAWRGFKNAFEGKHLRDNNSSAVFDDGNTPFSAKRKIRVYLGMALTQVLATLLFSKHNAPDSEQLPQQPVGKKAYDGHDVE